MSIFDFESKIDGVPISEYEPPTEEEKKEEVTESESLNPLLMIGVILGVLYSLLLTVYFYSDYGLINVLAQRIVFPHIACVVGGSVLGMMAIATRKKQYALISFVLYYGASLVFPTYAMYSIPIGVFVNIGWVMMKEVDVNE